MARHHAFPHKESTPLTDLIDANSNFISPSPLRGVETVTSHVCTKLNTPEEKKRLAICGITTVFK